MIEDTKKALNTNLQANVQEANKDFISSDYIIKSHELIEQGFKIYLLAQGTNSPYKGSNGHLDATDDVYKLIDMFNQYGANSNVAITLRDSKLVVLDIDRHTPDKNGLQTLKQLGITPNFDNETVESTPRNGIHLFYRVPDDLDVSSLKRNIGAGLELVTDKITVAPSVKGGVAYKHFGKSFNEASMMPQWLINLASSVPTSGNRQAKRVPKYSIQERWQMILDGFTEGERNNQAVSLAGYLLRIDVDPNVALSIVQKVNSESAVPLPDREIEAIFNSAYKREVKRARMGGR
ncbi:bifunctional DNA primase/polymerase [Leuconostoc citreum]|uniref:bifunctional DNA primase/polymerase n=1 Tax=Leuconostoc citreum TaxID=33964 RepID=UPI0021821908|nr:bifunctional DNA primase/polymerase [Leuconostoc citreum]MCS8587448.1 DNA primase [Leuconostoc citreum]MCS8599763.1 DNA primase [Leuconostoc citreum]